MNDSSDPFNNHLARFWTGEVEDPCLLAVFSGDNRFPHITGESIKEALEGFPLTLSTGWDDNRLAVAARRSLACVTPDEPYSPEHLKGSAKTRDELLVLASRTAELAAELQDMTGETEHAVLNLEDPDWAKYQAGLSALLTLPKLLERAASNLAANQTKWRSTDRQELHIRQAHCLAPIFEAAYRKPSIFNGWAGIQGTHGPWPDFFQRMVKLATDRKVKNLELVLKEARRRHKKQPVEYSSAIINLT